MKPEHQQHIDDYHADLKKHGHDMYWFHADWHRDNMPPPHIPSDAELGEHCWEHNDWGGKFLQMHHEMVRRMPPETAMYMKHASLKQWYGEHKPPYGLPVIGRSGDPPGDWLAYEPDVMVIPPELLQLHLDDACKNFPELKNESPEFILRRDPEYEPYTLPTFFSPAGGSSIHRYTGCRQLSDFKNANQLGCALSEFHDAWHLALGGKAGAIGDLAIAIADPMFYFGVHWYVDDVYEAFRNTLGKLAANQKLKMELHAQPPPYLVPPPLSPDERCAREAEWQRVQGSVYRIVRSDAFAVLLQQHRDRRILHRHSPIGANGKGRPE